MLRLGKGPRLPLPCDLEGATQVPQPARRTTPALPLPLLQGKGEPTEKGENKFPGQPHRPTQPAVPPTYHEKRGSPDRARRRKGGKSHPLPAPGREQTPVGWASQPGSPKEGWGRRVPAPKPNKARPEPQPGRIAQPRLFLPARPGRAGPRRTLRHGGTRLRSASVSHPRRAAAAAAPARPPSRSPRQAPSAALPLSPALFRS